MTRKSHPDTKRNDATGQGLHVLNHFNISGQIILLFNKRRRIQKASRPVPEGRYAPSGTEPAEKGGRKNFSAAMKKKKVPTFFAFMPRMGELNCGYTKTSGYALRTWPAQHRKSLHLLPYPQAERRRRPDVEFPRGEYGLQGLGSLGGPGNGLSGGPEHGALGPAGLE